MNARLFGVAFLLFAAACTGDDPSPEALISEGRILAVRADPPVVSIGQSAMLSALTAGPVGTRMDESVIYRACYPWRPLLDPVKDCGPDASIELPGGEFSAARVIDAFPPPDEVLASFETPRAPGDRCGAAYVSWDFPVVAEGRTDDTLVVASKRIRVALTDLRSPRGNPEIAALLVDGRPVVSSSTYAVGTDYELSVEINRDSIDLVCDDDIPQDEALESLQVRFYATGGAFLGSTIDAELGLDGQEAIGKASWSRDESGPVLMWVVVTDREGGIGWRQFLFDSAE